MKGSVLLLLVALAALQALQQRADLACAAVLCPAGFRCQEGLCLRQQKQAKASICHPLSPRENLQAVRCTSRDFKCDAAAALPACGFTPKGLRRDFSDDCSPCLDEQVDFFYRRPCSESPAVCSEVEQCLNGACVEMFNSAADSNLKICNSSSDCKPVLEICVANKCVSKMGLISALQAARPART